MKINEEINMEGKIAIGLNENRYVIRGKVLIAVMNSTLVIYELQEQLTKEEIKILNKDLSYGLKRIEVKLRESAPLTVTNGNIYYADMAVVRGGERMAYIVIF